MVAFGKPLGTFTRKTYRHEVIIFRKRIPVDLSIIKFVKIPRFRLQQKLS